MRQFVKKVLPEAAKLLEKLKGKKGVTEGAKEAAKLADARKTGEAIEEGLNNGANWGQVGEQVSFKGKALKTAGGGAVVAGAAGLESCQIEQHQEYTETEIDYDKLASTIANALYAKFKPELEELKTANADRTFEIIAAMREESQNIQNNQTSNTNRIVDKGQEIVDAIKLAGIDIGLIVERLTTNNNLLQEFKAQQAAIGDQQAADNEALLAEIINLQGFVKDVKASVDNLPEAIQPQVQAIINAIESGSATVTGAVEANGQTLVDIRGLLQDLKTTVEGIKGDTSNLQGIKAKLAALNFQESIQIGELAGILAELKNIGGTVKNIDNKLQLTLDKLDDILQNQKDGNQLLTDIKAAINNLDEDMKANFQTLLDAVVANGNRIDELKPLLVAVTNAVNENTEADKQNTGAILRSIAMFQGSVQFGIMAILAQGAENGRTLQQIANTAKEIEKVSVQIKEAIENLDTNMQEGLSAIFTQCVENGEKLDQQTEVMKEISAKISKLDTNMQAGMMAIFRQLVANGCKLNQINSFLAQLNDAVNNLNSNMKVGMTNLLTAVVNNGIKIDKNTQAINDNTQAIKELQNITKQVVAAVEKLDSTAQEGFMKLFNQMIEANGSLTDIRNLLKTIDKDIQINTEQDKENADRLIAAINIGVAKVGGAMAFNTAGIIHAIYANGDKVSTKIDELTNLVKALDENNETRNQAILKAIEQLDGDMITQFTNVQKTINNANANFGSKLGDYVDKIVRAINNSANSQNSVAMKNTKAILDAMSKIKVDNYGDVDLSTIERMLGDLVGLAKTNNGILADIKTDTGNLNVKLETANITLEAIKEKIPTEITVVNNGGNNYDDTKVLAALDKIFTAIGNIKPGEVVVNTEKFDDTKILGKLQEILLAIKDHKVHVDVEVLVKLEKMAQEGNNEGIISEIQNLFVED